MKMRIAGSVVLTLAGVLLAGGVARAQGPGGTGMGPGMGSGMMQHEPPMGQAFQFQGVQGRWWNNPRVVEQLKLTDDQRKAMDGILYDHREKLIDLQANLEKAELAMQPLMSADQPNEATIDAQIDKVVQARADLERANARFLLALRLKLTPEQWQQVKNFGADRGMRGQQRRDWGPNGQGHGMRGPGMRGPDMRGPGMQGPGGPNEQQMPPPPPQASPAPTPGTQQ